VQNEQHDKIYRIGKLPFTLNYRFVKSSRLFAYLQLMRPANIVTAMADILAGVATVSLAFILFREIVTDSVIEGFKITDASTILYPFVQEFILHSYTLWLVLESNGIAIILLLISTIGLYGGGVVFNDVFDAELDAVERPERPIPSGRVTVQGAAILGGVLLIWGILFAFLVSILSGCVAVLIAFFALLYDKIGKHQPWGPLNMGLCRGLNLFLGATVYKSYEIHGTTDFLGLSFGEFISFSVKEESPLLLSSEIIIPGFIAVIPIFYIAAITAVSRGEVHGGSKRSFYLPFVLYGVVVLAILGILFLTPIPVWQSLPFWLFFVWLIFPPLVRAYRDPQPRHIGRAVKAGVIALIVMDATIAAAFAGVLYGLLVLALLPVSRLLARYFAVT